MNFPCLENLGRSLAFLLTPRQQTIPWLCLLETHFRHQDIQTPTIIKSLNAINMCLCAPYRRTLTVADPLLEQKHGLILYLLFCLHSVTALPDLYSERMGREEKKEGQGSTSVNRHLLHTPRPGRQFQLTLSLLGTLVGSLGMLLPGNPTAAPLMQTAISPLPRCPNSFSDVAPRTLFPLVASHPPRHSFWAHFKMHPGWLSFVVHISFL